MLLLLESHFLAKTAATAHPNSFSAFSTATAEARHILQHYEYADVTNEVLDGAKTLSCSLLEAYRMTGHSLGAVRKVMNPVGWKVTVEGEKEKEYVIPYGTYVGASHIITHRDSSM
jgi:hypothetical protein